MSIEPHKPVPWPIQVQPSNRDSMLDRSDALTINVYQEKMANGEIHTVKRPCFEASGAGVIGLGKGAHQRLFTTDITVYRITDGVTLGPMTGGSDHIAPCTYADLDFASLDTFINGGFLSGNLFFIAGGAAPLTVVNGPKAHDGGPYAPGVVWLNGTVYLMTYSGKIYGSDVGAYTTWQSGNVISTNVQASLGMALAKQKVYVVAFSRFATTVFYNAGNPTGSPLSLLPGGQSSIGLYDHNTLQSIGDDLYWVGTPSTVNLGVYKMSDLKITKISTPAVERMLSLAQFITYPYVGGSFTGATPTTRSLSLAVFGHRYYVLNLYTIGFSLVYDTEMGVWYLWQTPQGTALPYFTPLTYGGNISTESYAASQVPELNRFQSQDGAIYRFNPRVYSDLSGVPLVRIITDNFDAGTHVKKYFKRFDFLADQVAGSFLQVMHSEDDYQTWSAPRSVNLGLKNPHLMNLGTFTRRAYRFYHQANTPFRIRGANAHLMPGSV